MRNKFLLTGSVVWQSITGQENLVILMGYSALTFKVKQ
jgi:hypothetical protein